MLVMAGVAASTGKGTTGAFGNGSGSTSGAVAAELRSARGALGGRAAGGVGGAGGTAGELFAAGCFADAGGCDETGFRADADSEAGAGDGGASAGAEALLPPFVLRGLSHFPQRIPCEIAAPHMKHLAMALIVPDC